MFVRFSIEISHFVLILEKTWPPRARFVSDKIFDILCLSLDFQHHCHVVLFLYVQWVEVRGDCSFCGYWWIYWPSLFKLLKPNGFSLSAKDGCEVLYKEYPHRSWSSKFHGYHEQHLFLIGWNFLNLFQNWRFKWFVAWRIV